MSQWHRETISSTDLYDGVSKTRLWSYLPSGGSAVELCIFNICIQQIQSLIFSSCALDKLIESGRVVEREKWLKLPVIAMKAHGYFV